MRIQLQIPGQVSKSDTEIKGKISLTTKSEQEIVSSEVEFIKEFTYKKGDEKRKKTYNLGKTHLPDQFKITPGETKEIPFQLPFTLVQSDSESLKDQGGALGAFGIRQCARTSDVNGLCLFKSPKAGILLAAPTNYSHMT